MNRSLLVWSLGLSAVLGSAALYSRFTATTPVAPAVSLAVRKPSAPTSRPSAPPPVASAELGSELQRLRARRVLYETVAALLETSEFDRARQLLDEDQARYGQDLTPPWRDLEQAYRLIADCLERPRDAKARIRARAFIAVSEAGALVPKLRAACGP